MRNGEFFLTTMTTTTSTTFNITLFRIIFFCHFRKFTTGFNRSFSSFIPIFFFNAIFSTLSSFIRSTTVNNKKKCGGSQVLCQSFYTKKKKLLLIFFHHLNIFLQKLFVEYVQKYIQRRCEYLSFLLQRLLTIGVAKIYTFDFFCLIWNRERKGKKKNGEISFISFG